jgi:hypothetical protein
VIKVSIYRYFEGLTKRDIVEGNEMRGTNMSIATMSSERQLRSLRK